MAWYPGALRIEENLPAVTLVSVIVGIALHAAAFPKEPIVVRAANLALCMFVLVIACELFSAGVSTRTLAWSVIHAALLGLPFASENSAVWPHLGRLASSCTVSHALTRCGLLALLGSWIGACLIKYDWELPWQPWPYSSLYVALPLYVLGLAAQFVRRG